jgi:hypothetical protein
VRAKSSHHRAKSSQVDLFEFRSRGAELLEQAKEMVWSPANRNSREPLGIRKSFIGEQLFRSESQQETQMLRRGRQATALRSEESAKVGRGDEFYPERGEAGFEHATFEALDLTARWNDNDSREVASPRFRRGLAKPSFRRALPGRVCRGGKQ